MFLFFFIRNSFITQQQPNRSMSLSSTVIENWLNYPQERIGWELASQKNRRIIVFKLMDETGIEIYKKKLDKVKSIRNSWWLAEFTACFGDLNKKQFKTILQKLHRTRQHCLKIVITLSENTVLKQYKSRWIHLTELKKCYKSRRLNNYKQMQNFNTEFFWKTEKRTSYFRLNPPWIST